MPFSKEKLAFVYVVYYNRKRRTLFAGSPSAMFGYNMRRIILLIQEQLYTHKRCLYAVFLYYASSFASFSSCAVLSAFSADLIVTVFSAKVMFLLFSNIPFITLAAVGAQVPFSIMPIVRF